MNVQQKHPGRKAIIGRVGKIRVGLANFIADYSSDDLSEISRALHRALDVVEEEIEARRESLGGWG